MKKTTTVLGWHILPCNRLLKDERRVNDRVWYRAKIPFMGRYKNTTKKIPEFCSFGMHACKGLESAIYYAKCLHPTCHNSWVHICRIELSGNVMHKRGDAVWPPKMVGLKRRIIWSVYICWWSDCILLHNKIDTLQNIKDKIRKAYLKKYKKPLTGRIV